MTIQQIQTKLEYAPEYKFLETHPNLGDNIILLGLGGSHAYGIANPNSDLDIRGIAVNTREELLLQRDFEQVVNIETDTTIYSLQKMIKLLTDCNPNTIEILGLEPWQYLEISDIGQQLLNHKECFLSKKAIHTFSGYANSQLYRLKQLCTHTMPQTELEQHIFKTLQNAQQAFPEDFKLYGTGELKLYIDASEREDMDTEIYLDANFTHYPLRDYCNQWNTLQNIVRSYNKLGKRNQHAREHNKIAKHMTHLLRLNMMCLDILKYGEIKTYRKDELPLLREIRQGAYITDNNQVKPEFYTLVEDYEQRLEQAKLRTKLPDQPDYKRINKLLMNIHETIICKA